MTPQPTVQERWKAILGPMQQPARAVMGIMVAATRGFPSGICAVGAHKLERAGQGGPS